MSKSIPSGNDCTDADLTAVVSELADRVADLEQTVEEQQATIEDLEAELKDERESRARADAEQRQRLHDVEEAVEEGETATADPTPDTGKDASTEPLTPVERLSASGDSTDVATNVTASVRRAVTLFENLPDWGSSTPKGRVLKPSDRPKQLLEAACDESLAWTQYYRAAEALERLSKGGVTFFDHQKHGKTVVLHDGTDVHDRAVQSGTNDSRVSSVAH
jgi:uncharacterized coiled-coil protein SlyX